MIFKWWLQIYFHSEGVYIISQDMEGFIFKPDTIRHLIKQNTPWLRLSRYWGLWFLSAVLLKEIYSLLGVHKGQWSLVASLFSNSSSACKYFKCDSSVEFPQRNNKNWILSYFVMKIGYLVILLSSVLFFFFFKHTR